MALGSFADPDSVWSVDPNPDPWGPWPLKWINYRFHGSKGLTFFFGGWWKFAWSMEVLEEISVRIWIRTFWASGIRILIVRIRTFLSTSKKKLKNLDFYCFLCFKNLIFLMTDVNVLSVSTLMSKETWKKAFFGILKAIEEKSRIRIRTTWENI
jgi:hypothetical protein